MSGPQRTMPRVVARLVNAAGVSRDFGLFEAPRVIELNGRIFWRDPLKFPDRDHFHWYCEKPGEEAPHFFQRITMDQALAPEAPQPETEAVEQLEATELHEALEGAGL